MDAIWFLVMTCAWRAGGTFALYSLLCRHIGILPGSRQSAVPDPADVLLSAYSSASELGAPAGPKPRRRTVGARIREGIKGSAFAQSVRCRPCCTGSIGNMLRAVNFGVHVCIG